MGRLLSSGGILAVLMMVCVMPASAANHITISDQDCNSILENYAAAPKSVPADVVKACQQAPAIAPGAGAAAAASSPTDPCSGAGAAGSVYCWGPWGVLAPAAGNAPVIPLEITEQEPRPELASVFDPEVSPILPQAGCAPGASCGFATVVSGTAAVASAADTSFASFDLADDGTSFVVDAGGVNEIQSVTMGTGFIDRPDDYENMFAVGQDNDQISVLIARVIRQGNDEIQYGADIWINDIAGVGSSGNFAWGNAASQADLDTLNNTGIGTLLTFSGPMSVDVATTAVIALQLGPAASWTGSWTNPAYAFSAGGGINGADFLSNPDSFSSNVESGYVQGALLGPLGDHAVTHIIDVTLDGVGDIKDVGLLR
jgi:hypothetical protein